MYDAESKVSHPKAIANGMVRGCPAPNRCRGI